jgi:hypothetical protein
MSADLVRQLSALGLNLEQVAGVMDIIDAQTESRREKGRERWHKWKEKRGANVSQRLPTDTNVGSPLTRVEDSSSKKDISGKEESKNLSHEFENEIWPAYPRKAGKGAALKAYITARKRASFETIQAGVRRYAQERAGEDAQFTKHAQGWFNGDHWADEPIPKRPHSTASPPIGKRMNAVEANLARRIRKDESASGRRDYGDVQLLPPDRPGLPDFAGDVGKALTWRG